MLKKIFTLQKFLFANSSLPFESFMKKYYFTSKKYSNTEKHLAIILLATSILYMIFINQAMYFFIISTAAVLIVRGFISYNKNFIALLPVSSTFKFFSFHLFSLLFFIFVYLIIIIFGMLFFLFILILALFAGGSLNNLSSSLNNSGSLLLLYTILIYHFILLSIMFIKGKHIRYIFSIGFSVAYFLVLTALNKFILSYSKSKISNDMFMNFSNVHNSNHIIFILGIITILAIIISITISYFIFIKDINKYELIN